MRNKEVRHDFLKLRIPEASRTLAAQAAADAFGLSRVQAIELADALAAKPLAPMKLCGCPNSKHFLELLASRGIAVEEVSE